MSQHWRVRVGDVFIWWTTQLMGILNWAWLVLKYWELVIRVLLWVDMLWAEKNFSTTYNTSFWD